MSFKMLAKTKAYPLTFLKKQVIRFKK